MPYPGPEHTPGRIVDDVTPARLNFLRSMRNMNSPEMKDGSPMQLELSKAEAKKVVHTPGNMGTSAR